MLLQLQLFSGFVKVVWWIFTAEKNGAAFPIHLFMADKQHDKW